MLVAGKLEEEKDGELAERTGACWSEGATLGPTLRPQASKRGTRRVCPSRRRLRGSLPVVRHDRTSKWQRRSCARRAVGADGKRREIALRRKAVGYPYSPYCLEEDAFSETRSTPYFVGSPELAKVEEEAVDDQAKR